MGEGVNKAKQTPDAAEKLAAEQEHEPEQMQCNSSVHLLVLLSALAAEFYLQEQIRCSDLRGLIII